MIVSWITFFIAVTLIALLVSAYLMETYPVFSIPFIFIGLIFSVICTYSLWDVEWAVLRSDDTFIMESVSYGDPFSYVFVFIFFVFLLFFIRAGWNMVQESLATKGEISYTTNKDYFR